MFVRWCPSAISFCPAAANASNSSNFCWILRSSSDDFVNSWSLSWFAKASENIQVHVSSVQELEWRQSRQKHAIGWWLCRFAPIDLISSNELFIGSNSCYFLFNSPKQIEKYNSRMKMQKVPYANATNTFRTYTFGQPSQHTDCSIMA